MSKERILDLEEELEDLKYDIRSRLRIIKYRMNEIEKLVEVNKKGKKQESV